MSMTVLCGRERRRRWSAAEKLRMVEESLVGGATVAEIARRHEVHPNLLHGWRRQARTGGLQPRGEEADHFAAVVVADNGVAGTTAKRATAAAPAIEVMLRNGRMLRVAEGVGSERVAALADALEGIGS